MKKVYESPEAEVIDFVAEETVATLEGKVRLDNFGNDNFEPGVESGRWF